MKKLNLALLGLLLATPATSLIPHTGTTLAAPAKASDVKAIKAKGAATKPKDAPKKPSAAAIKGMKEMPAPASKGGKKTKDPTFLVHIDLRTTDYVDVYIDGSYRGTVGPWSDGYFYAISGATKVYCEAQDGRWWNFDITSYKGTYDLRLYP